MADYNFTIRRQPLALAGAHFRFFNDDGKLFGYCRKHPFQLRECFRIYQDEAGLVDWLEIQERVTKLFVCLYDVVDAHTKAKLGAVGCKPARLFRSSQWTIFDRDENPLGKIDYHSPPFKLRGAPRSWSIGYYDVSDDVGALFGTMRFKLNPFLTTLEICLADERIDPLLVLSAGILIIDGDN